MNRYQNTPIAAGNYYQTTVYPEVPLHQDDIYLIATQTDRLDILAYEYYSDSSLWWVIASANTHLDRGSLSIPAGLQIRIPGNVNEVLAQFNSVNSSR